MLLHLNVPFMISCGFQLSRCCDLLTRRSKALFNSMPRDVFTKGCGNLRLDYLEVISRGASSRSPVGRIKAVSWVAFLVKPSFPVPLAVSTCADIVRRCCIGGWYSNFTKQYSKGMKRGMYFHPGACVGGGARIPIIRRSEETYRREELQYESYMRLNMNEKRCVKGH